MCEIKRGRLAGADIKRFVMGGNAIFTIQNPKTGGRFTFKVNKPEDAKTDDFRFVALLGGPDNTSDYRYLGTIGRGRFYHGKKSRISKGAPSAKAFAWFFERLGNPSALDNIEVYHEARCGACGRKLTVPESVQTGFGPDCAAARGIAMAKKPRKAKAKKADPLVEGAKLAAKTAKTMAEIEAEEAARESYKDAMAASDDRARPAETAKERAKAEAARLKAAGDDQADWRDIAIHEANRASTGVEKAAKALSGTTTSLDDLRSQFRVSP